ncbi:hypothetical protein BACPU_25950 [Bacillus pumilus]|nr:hypothetical protein BACPU_25950 [Bacillus pumilus]
MHSLERENIELRQALAEVISENEKLKAERKTATAAMFRLLISNVEVMDQCMPDKRSNRRLIGGY